MSAKVETNKVTTKLNDGNDLPVVGLGTYQATEKNAAYNAVLDALKAGYRHIDTATMYGNEEEIGKAVRDSGIPRKEVFVTTKLWGKDHTNAEAALDLSLKKLGFDYVDLYLMHWPIPLDPKYPGDYAVKPDGTRAILEGWTFIDTYKELQKLLKAGKAKSIGVSNFTIKRLEELIDHKDIDVVPVVNQVEMHPLLPQYKLLEFGKKHHIKIEAYSPLGSSKSPLFKNETIVEIAKKNGVSSAQVLVSWAVQRGTIVLPKSVSPVRIAENIKTFELSDEDFTTLNKLTEKYGVVRTCDPDYGNFVVFDDSDLFV